MTRTLLFLVFQFIVSLFISTSQAQTKTVYHPEANASFELSQAISLAKTTSKHVLVIVGGNWCPWCLKLNAYLLDDQEIDSIINQKYVIVKVNYSKEQKNLPLLMELEYPQRFGFPVMLILDKYGSRMHTQDSGLLESGSGYDKTKVTTFLKMWSPDALDASKYD